MNLAAGNAINRKSAKTADLPNKRGDRMKGKIIDVVPGVYMVGGPGVSSGDDCCVYLLESQGESCIIDTGAGRSMGLILDNIRNTGVDLQSIRYIIVTHGHIDHIGGLKQIKEAVPAEIIAHRLDLPAIEEGRPELTAAAWYGVKYEGVKVDQVLDQDQGFRVGEVTVQCVHTPGHTPGSISVYADLNNKRILFAQDVHGPFMSEWGSDKKEWSKSMQYLIGLNADILCEGHYGIYSPAAQVRAYIEGYLNRF